MALRSRAFSSSVLENQVNGGNQPGKQLLGVRPLAQRSALGDIKNINNVRHNSTNDSQASKELIKPVKPVTRSGPKQNKENAVSEEKNNKFEEIELMETSSNNVLEMVENDIEQVEDIDKDDEKNPQLVVDYVNDIYAYLRQLEEIQVVQEDYMQQTTTILPKMRGVLIDWLVGVHLQFHLLQETLYTTVAILDRFLQVEVGNITRNKLQLVGVTAMLIASKYEEIYAPEIKDFVYITDKAYTDKEIMKMEVRILTTLQFNLGRPLPLHFLRRASKAGGVEAATHTLAKYVMELSLGSYSLCATPPSTLAAAALALSARLLQPGTSLEEIWSNTLVHYTNYTLKEIHPTLLKLIELLVSAPTAKLNSVFQKYCNKKFMKIARIPALESSRIKAVALENVH